MLYLFAIILLINFTNSQITLITNALDKNGFHYIINFIELSLIYSNKQINEVFLYVHNDTYQYIVNHSISLSLFKSYHVYNQSNDIDNSRREYVNEIIESWVHTSIITNNNIILSIACDYSNNILPTTYINNLYDNLLNSNSYDIKILSKNSKLNSISTWLDISIISFNISNNYTISLIKKFSYLYRINNHNQRAFKLLDPRPALSEAIARYSNHLTIDYFNRHNICSTVNKSFIATISNNYINSKCLNNILSSLQVHCLINEQYKYSDNCLSLHLSNHWKNSVEIDIPSHLNELVGHNDDIMAYMDFGLLRFRNASNNSPKKFCWENKYSNADYLSKSRVEYNLSHSDPFTHPKYEYYTNNKSKLKVLMLSGSKGSANKLVKNLYISLSKQMYCKRHGYKYVIKTSVEYENFIRSDLFESIDYPFAKSPYARGVLSKPVMILDTMYHHIDSDWIVWTDDDQYINPGWLYLPLDAFIDDIPSNKLMITANTKSAFTNVLIIRNNQFGRQLIVDWLTISLSGHIQCHGFDQAAMGLLILQRLDRYIVVDSTKIYTERKPLNYTCLYSDDGNLGCNKDDKWTCDARFEIALNKAGYKTKLFNQYADDVISSYSKGCVNEFIDDFHIITETSFLPRLQCGLCTRLDEIESAGSSDCQLGAGNDVVRSGAVNGWLLNHKAEFLFYESYINPSSCLYYDDITPICPTYHMREFMNIRIGNKVRKSLVSLVDGYAFDFNIDGYCKINPKNQIIKYQRLNTYMADYKSFIELVNQYNDSYFSLLYKQYSGTLGRDSCVIDNPSNPCTNGYHIDGQRNRRPKPPYNDDMHEKFFLNQNYCSNCIVSYNNHTNHNVIDCYGFDNDYDIDELL